MYTDIMYESLKQRTSSGKVIIGFVCFIDYVVIDRKIVSTTVIFERLPCKVYYMNII